MQIVVEQIINIAPLWQSIFIAGDKEVMYES